MIHGDIIAIGHVDLRYLNQPGKIVIETPLAAPSSLIAIGPAAAAALRPAGIVSTNVIAIGADALLLATAASQRNIAIGRAALGATTGALTDSIAIGDGALALAAAGTGFSVAVGNSALAALTTGNNNAVLGYNAAPAGNPSRIVAMGSDVLALSTVNTIGGVYIGSEAARSAAAGAEFNVVVGYQAMRANTAAPIHATVIGHQAMLNGVGAHDANVAIGYRVALAVTTGGENTIVGASAAPVLTTGARNTILGRNSATGLISGNDNILHGYLAGTSLVSGSGNVLIGRGGGGGGGDVPAGGSSNYIAISAFVFGGALPSLVVVDPALRGVHIGSLKPGNWLTASGLDNIAIGSSALSAATTATRNVGVGTQALFRLTTGADNVAVGLNAMLGAAGSEASIQNVAVGAQALDAINATVRDTTAIGYRAGTEITAGIRNTLVGSEAGAALTTGGYNTLVGGFNPAPTLTTGDRNVVIGSYVGGLTTMATLPAADSFGYIVISANLDAAGGGPNIIVSDRALRNLHFGSGKPGNWLTATGADNVAIGDGAMAALTSGTTSVAVGSSALGAFTTGTANVAVGYHALLINTTGFQNFAGGAFALGNLTTGSRNVGIGQGALSLAPLATSRNTVVGATAADAINTAVTDNVIIGDNAVGAATTVQDVVVIGASALLGTTSTTARTVIIGTAAVANSAAAGPTDGVFIGYRAGFNTTVPAGTIAIGSLAAPALTTAPYNVLIGYGVANNLTTGRNNVVIGAYQGTALFARTSAVDSTGQIVIAAEADTESGVRQSLVVVALQSVYVGSAKPGNWLTSTGLSNVGIGDAALGSQTTGTLNVAVGAFAGGGVTTGSNNTLLGNNAGSSLTTGLRNILIGNAVGQPAAATDDFLNIGKTIFADLAGKNVRIGDVETATVVGQTERLAVTTTNADTVAPFSIATTGANGAKIFKFCGTRDPNGVVAGDPGDHYERKNGTGSTLYINTGAAAANTVWTSLVGPLTFSQAQIPIETDDTSAGYRVGDRIYSTAARSWYTADTVTAGAAVWRRDTQQLRWPLSITPQVANVVTQVGFDGVAFGGTGTTPALATTNLRTSLRRIHAELAFGGSVRSGPAMFWRGDAAAQGGFYIRFVIATSTTAAGQMSFSGLIAANPGLPFDTQTLVSCFGVGNQAADANINVIHNDSAGNVTAVDLGANFPALNTAAVYDVELYCAANDTNLYYVVHRRDTLFVARGVVTTNMPANTTFLLPFFAVSDLSGDVVGVDLMYMVGEIPIGHGDAAA